MTPVQSEAIANSFRIVQSRPEEFSEAFFGRLFELDPALSQLFSVCTFEQANKLLGAFSFIVRHRDNIEGIRQPLERLAVRHLAYGVHTRHYQLVRTALVSAFRQAAGDGFSKEMKIAWLALYDRVAAIMLTAHRNGVLADLRPRIPAPPRDANAHRAIAARMRRA